MIVPLGLSKAAIVEPHSAGWKTFKGGPLRVLTTAPSRREFCVGQKLALGLFFSFPGIFEGSEVQIECNIIILR